MPFCTEENQSLKFVCTRRTLVNIILESTSDNLDEKIKQVELFLIKNTGCSVNRDSKIKTIIKTLKSQFKTKWSQSNRTKSIFLTKQSKWLDGKIECCKHPNKRVGRPIGDFESSSEQVKRKRTAGLRASTSTSELVFATQMKLRAEGLKDTAELLTNISNSSCDKEDTTEQMAFDPITPLQALSMVIQANLTRQQYEVIRSYAKHIFPSYKMLQKEKQNSYPEGITVTETEATVPIQSLVDNTTEKIVQAQKSVFETYEAAELTMTYKWGFDGSSGHSQYHQSYLSEKSGDDKFVFIACLVPLQLVSSDNRRIYWKNEHPSSSALCRPIKIIFEKESDSLVETVKQSIDQQIKNLTYTTVKLNGIEYKINHNLIFSMIDGKLCNSLSDTKSALRCYLCRATSKDFNNIDKVLQLPIVEDYLSFGMSVLHAWIRMFECLLHISYKLEVKEWRSSKKIEAKIKENKTRIQNLFKEKMGLIVDQPKPGYGNTNTGNVARRFFQNAELSAEITGIDLNILHRFYIILQCMSSGFPVDKEKFRTYCHETARLFTKIYPWYHMSTTVHKILIHGHDIISKSLLPIGQLSEEALEARNKDFKDYRQYFSRKTSRKDTIMDIFNRMLISSDPLLKSIQTSSLKKKRLYFHEDAIEMFANISFNEETEQQS